LIPAGKAIQKAGQGVKAIGRMFGIGGKEKKAEKTAKNSKKSEEKPKQQTNNDGTKNNQKSAEKSQKKGSGSNAKNAATGEKNTEKSAGNVADKIKPITSEGKANAATGVKLNRELELIQMANEPIESLRRTGKLPNNYITQTEAEKNGWKKGKALNNTNPGKVLGGDIYNNKPIRGTNTTAVANAAGKIWHEVDIGIDYTKSRSKQNGTRVLYSSDGLLYISPDHYQSPAIYIGRWK
ncbi:MAG: hypothetical protein IJ566_08720, partial [Cardiobacteriaceae bacterium]|nr:hypothetical protein [Cardiobacteriaceae bacterium]